MLNLILWVHFKNDPKLNAKKNSPMWNERIYSLTRMELIKGHKNTHNQQQQTTIETLCHFILTHNGAMEHWSAQRKPVKWNERKTFHVNKRKMHTHTYTLPHSVYFIHKYISNKLF